MSFDASLRDSVADKVDMLGFLPGALSAAMLEAFGVVPMNAEMKRFVSAPIVVHCPPGWTAANYFDSMEWMPQQIRAERLEIALGKRPTWLVGPTEIAAVMHAASLQAPFRDAMGDLYLWATSHAIARHRKVSFSDIWNMVAHDHRLITDDDVLGRRNSSLHMEYLAIAGEIRRKLDRYAKSTSRSTRDEESTIEIALPIAAE
jgi:hypothetical protein